MPMAGPGVADRGGADMTADVTVVIPTLAVRRDALDRSIASVLGQRGVASVRLVVVNGTRFDPGDVAALAADPRIRVERIAGSGVSAARLAGRRAVASEFFAFLDDDDELLPDSLARSVARMRADPSVDVVVTNGLRDVDGVRTICFDGFATQTDDAARDLVRENWLASCGGVYRTAAVGPESFAGLPDYFEMTLLAFRLALSQRIVRIDEPGFVIHEDAAGRASQSLRYHLAEQAVIREMAAIAPDAGLRRALRKKRSAALHHCAAVCLAEGRRREAWTFHLRSIVTGGGWRYIPSTRHLVTSRQGG